MAALTPEGRAFEAERDAEAARETQGVYVRERLADLLARGEKSFDEVLDIVRSGNVTYRARPFPSDTTNLAEQDANATYNPFMALTIGANAVLTPEQYETLLAAESDAAGRPGGFSDGEFDDRFFGGDEFSDHQFALARIHDDDAWQQVYRVKDRVKIDLWQPKMRMWRDASGFAFDKLYGPNMAGERKWVDRFEARDQAREFSRDPAVNDMPEWGIESATRRAAAQLTRSGPYYE